MKVSRKIMSVFMSFVLAVGLCPGVAYAESLVGVDLQATPIAGETEAVLSVDVSDGILQNGGLIREAPTQTGPMLGAQSVPDYEGFEAALLAAAENWDGETESVRVDVSGCNVYKDQLKSLFRYFLNNNGQLFYVSSAYSYNAYSSESNAQVSAIVLRFDTSYDSDDLTVFSSAVEKALSDIEQNWTDEQKALYLHDWLVTHCEYDLTYSKHSAYNALVEGSAVCQGYALAYDYLLKRAGVECDVVTSELINHAWNLATIDGATYYVDCTWDDPSNIEFEAYCAHGYFLRSKSEFGHIGQAKGEQKTPDGSIANDWLDSSGANVYENTSIGSSTSYDSAYWIDTITAIPHVGSLWAYVDSTVGDPGKATTIKVHDYATGENRTLATIQPGIWRPWGNASAYLGTRYANLVSNGEAFLATTPTSLVKIAPDGTATTAYELTDEEAATGHIYGLTYDPETETCRYELGTALTEEQTGFLTLKSTGSGTFEFPPIKTSIATATVTAAPQVYAGTALTPVVSVALDGQTLDPETDYSIVYPSDCVNAGNYTVTVVGEGNYRGKASGTFTISPKPVTVSAQPASKTFGTADPQLEATVEGLLDGDIVDYSLSRAPGEDVGEYAITASGEAAQGNYAVSFSPSVLAITPASIDGAELVLSATSFDYNGELQMPTIASVGGSALVNDVDYELKCSSPSPKAPGTYDVWVVGQGNYSGTSAKTSFEITPVDISDAIIVLSDAAFTYNGQTQKPTVKTVGGAPLAEGVDYELHYSDDASTEVGSYKVWVEGKGNCSGVSAEATYVIAPKPVTVAAQPASKTFGENDPQLEATVEGLLDGDIVYYSLSRAPGEDAGEYAITASGEGAQGNYVVAYKPGVFVVNAASLREEATVSIEDSHLYTGSELRPLPTVQVGSVTLQEGADYTLAYEDNVNAGIATVTIEGTGNYAGKTSINFTILPASIDNAPLALSGTEFTYNGKIQTPTVKTVGGKALKAGADYAIYYSNVPPRSVGVYPVRVVGMGNYSGTAFANFAIKPAPISAATITGIATKTYTGKAIAQTPVVKFGATTLRKGADYDLSFQGNTKAGTNTASVTISGKGNFTESVTKKFSIAKAANPMSVATKAPSIKAKKKKAATVKGGAAFKFKKKAAGAVTYKRIAKGSAKWLPKVNAKTGAITVKAGTRKGTYKIKVKVSAKGNANYKATSKTLTIKVKVK